MVKFKYVLSEVLFVWSGGTNVSREAFIRIHMRGRSSLQVPSHSPIDTDYIVMALELWWRLDLYSTSVFVTPSPQIVNVCFESAVESVTHVHV